MNNRLEDFGIYLTKRGNDPKTISAYLGDTQQYADWFQSEYGKPFHPGALTGADILGYRRYLRARRGLKPATVNRKLRSLRVLVRYGIEAGEIHQVVGDEIIGEVAYVPEQDPLPRWIERQDFNRLKAEYQRSINDELVRGRTIRYRQAVMQYAVMMLLAGGGLRINEALDLDLEDVVLGDRSGHVVIRHGKGGGFAEQFIHPFSRQALGKWIEIRGEDPGPLFRSQQGTRLSDRQVQRTFKLMCQKAGIDGDYTPHSLRHTFIRNLVRAGVPIPEVKQLARHKRVEMTLRYAQAGQRDLQEAVEKVFD